MTVSNTTNRIAYAGNGSSTVFATPPFNSNSNIYAYLVDNATFVVTNQALTTHFTLAGAGTGADGSLTMLIPPPTGKTLVVSRIMPLSQSTDYVNADAFPADSHELALDKLTFITQQIATRQSRSMTLPDSDISGVDLTLPPPLAGTIPIINASRTAVEWYTPTAISVADGSITTVKLGGDITSFSKTLLTQGNATSWLAVLGFSMLGRTIIAVTNAAALRTAAGVSSIGDAIFTATTEAAAQGYLGATTLGKALFTAADAAAVRVAAGISTAGSAMVTAADAAAQRVLLGFTSFGTSFVTAADAAAGRVLLGVTSFGSSLLAAADAAAARALLSVTAEIPAGGVIQTVFSNTASVDLRIQGITSKVLVRAVIEYSGLTAGTVYLTVSDEGAPSSTLRTLNLDSVSADVNTATIEWEYAPGIVALHNLTYGVAVTGVTLVAQTISATEIKGGFTGTALPWSPADLTATNPKAFKAGLSPATDAVDRGGANTMYGGAVRTWWSRIGSPGTSDFECTDTPAWTMVTDPTSTYIANILVGEIPGADEYGLLLERAYTGEFTLAYQVRCSSDSFTGDVLFSAGYSSGAVASGSVLRRGFILRDAGMIDFGLDDDVGNKATYDATALDWTAWHSIVVRRTSAGVYHLHVDGSLVGTLTGAVFGGGGSEGPSNAHIVKTADTVSMYIFSAYLAATDVGTGADLTSLNTWLALAE